MAPQQPQDTSSILLALANMAKSNATPTPGGQLPQGGGHSFPGAQAALGQPMPPAVNQNAQFPQPVPTFNGSNVAGNANPLNAIGNAVSPFGAPAPAQAPSATPTAEQLQQQVQIIQMLQSQGIPPDQWAVVLQALMSAGAVGAPAPPAPIPNQNFNGAQNPNQIHNQANFGVSSRDHDRSAGYGMRSPPGRYRRSRSRSPPGYDRRRADDSPRSRRRDSPTYGNFGRSDDSTKNGYRQRSPERDRRRRSLTPPGQNNHLPPSGSIPKVINWDKSMPRDHIKGTQYNLVPILNIELTPPSSPQPDLVRGRRHVSSLAFIHGHEVLADTIVDAARSSYARSSFHTVLFRHASSMLTNAMPSSR